MVMFCLVIIVYVCLVKVLSELIFIRFWFLWNIRNKTVSRTDLCLSENGYENLKWFQDYSRQDQHLSSTIVDDVAKIYFSNFQRHSCLKSDKTVCGTVCLSFGSYGLKTGIPYLLTAYVFFFWRERSVCCMVFVPLFMWQRGLWVWKWYMYW